MVGLFSCLGVAAAYQEAIPPGCASDGTRSVCDLQKRLRHGRLSAMTRTQKLIDKHLESQGLTLAGLVKCHRKNGLGWERIAQEIAKTTDVYVSRETVRAWFAEKKR